MQRGQNDEVRRLSFYGVGKVAMRGKKNVLLSKAEHLYWVNNPGDWSCFAWLSKFVSFYKILVAK